MRAHVPDENHLKRLAALRLALRIALFPGPALLAGAQTIGMVADDATDSVVVFDADSQTVLGAVPVGPGFVGDCSVTDDQKLGFVTDFNFRLWVVDLASSPPVLAQPDPIRISNPGEDTALSPDGRFLVVCDGFGSDPISVVDVATRTEVGTFSLGSNCSSVDVCSDGSVLVASSNAGRVHRLLLNDSGALSHTGETLSTGWLASRGPNNVFCAPDAASGLVVRRSPQEVRSFRVPGLAPVDTRALTGPKIGISGQIAADGRAFVRSDGGSIDVFSYDSATATLGAAPILTVPVDPATNFLGIDQLALSPDAARLFVPESGALDVHDSTTGDLVGSLQHASIVSPTGVCLSKGPLARCGDGTVDEGEQCDDGNVESGDGCSAACEIENLPPQCDAAFPSQDRLWPPGGQREVVSVAGVSDPDGDPLQVVITEVMQDEAVTGGRAGSLCPDAAGVGGDHVELVSERMGGGDGRVYHVRFVADDGRGGQCAGTVQVCVPATPNGKKSVCVDQGALFDSSGC